MPSERIDPLINSIPDGFRLCPNCDGNSSPMPENPSLCGGLVCPVCNNLCDVCYGEGLVPSDQIEPLIKCRWCHRRITPMSNAYVDDDGLFNCGKFRRHWPDAYTALDAEADGDMG